MAFRSEYTYGYGLPRLTDLGSVWQIQYQTESLTAEGKSSESPISIMPLEKSIESLWIMNNGCLERILFRGK